jgi:hypothetical protein
MTFAYWGPPLILIATLLLTTVVVHIWLERRAPREGRGTRFLVLLQHVSLLMLDRAIFGARKLFTNKPFSFAASVVLLIWAIFELTGARDSLADLPGTAQLLGAIVVFVTVLHIAKVFWDEGVAESIRSEATSMKLLAHQLSTLPDIFVGDNGSQVSASEVCSRLTSMLRPLARIRKLKEDLPEEQADRAQIQVVAFRVERIASKTEVENASTPEQYYTHTYMGCNRVNGIPAISDIYGHNLANELTMQSLSWPKGAFSFKLLGIRQKNHRGERFRYACEVLENLQFEPHFPKYGRPLREEKGSCVVYTLGLEDGSKGYMVIALSSKRGAFRSRYKWTWYRYPMRACATLLVMTDLSLRPKQPKTTEASADAEITGGSASEETVRSEVKSVQAKKEDPLP